MLKLEECEALLSKLLTKFCLDGRALVMTMFRDFLQKKKRPVNQMLVLNDLNQATTEKITVDNTHKTDNAEEITIVEG